jgi:hypothetical protein
MFKNMKYLSRIITLLAVFTLLFGMGANSVLALNPFRSTTVATFRSIDPYGSVSKEFSIGDRNVFLSRVHIEPRNSAVKLRSITFTNLGTAENGDIMNVSLYRGETRLAGPFNSISNIVIHFADSYLIQPDFPVTFDLKGDIVDGPGKTVGFDPVVAENIQLVDENNADNIRLYKSEMSQDIVLDRIKGELASDVGIGTGPDVDVVTSTEGDGDFGGDLITVNPFPDTSLDDIKGRAAADLHEKGIISGYPDGEFKGTRSVNRVEALKILLEAKLGDIETQSFDGRFSDVPEGEWYVLYVMKALSLGIINGYPDGTFKPGNTVNTVEFLKMMNLTFGVEEGLEYAYGDVEASDWFAKYAGAAEKYEMFPDRPHFLVPASELTRNEMAVAIYQYLKNKE